MSVNTFEVALDGACGRTTTFKDKKQMDTWIRLHKKKCDKCRRAIFHDIDVEVQHDWGNRNELEREVARGNAIQEAIVRLIGGDAIHPRPRTI
jgi:hypothetical protein